MSISSYYLPYDYIEEEDFERGFAKYYLENIVPLGEKYEETRGRRRILYFSSMAAAAVSGLVTSYLIAKSTWFAQAARNGRKSGQILLLPFIFFWWLIVYRPKRHYFQALKEDVVPKILQFYGEFNYTSSGKIENHVLSAHTGYTSKLFNLINCEDFISFQMDGFSCTIAERVFWDIKKPTGSVFIHINSNSDFGIDAVIISKSRDKNYRNTNKKLLKRRNLCFDAALAGQQFDELFSLYTNDIRINKLFSEEFINALVLLDSAFNQEGLIFSIKDNSILIELRSAGNFFEVGTNHDVPVANPEDIRNFLRELTTTINLVDTLIQIINQPKKIDIQPEQKYDPNDIYVWSGRE